MNALHIHNRLGFGPRPEDLEGPAPDLGAYLERQLGPEAIDDTEVERALAGLETLDLSGIEMVERLGERGEQRRGIDELTRAKLIRVLSSRRQLNEVMVDFWFNHFNVFAGKGICRLLVSSFEREAIRPHALGRFSDLVHATARHPAMLFYLDNWLSVVPDARLASRRLGRRRGLNENYARELLELHTLGVDGGYTETDVVEVARSLTGWTIQGPRRPAFVFAPRLHDRGPKWVLGRRVEGSGIEEGLEVIDRLSRHPSTARFISRKLAVRFVSDQPSGSLVAAAEETFGRSGGDIRAVVRTLVLSEEFAASESRKVKTPLEFLASVFRRTGAELRNPLLVARLLRTMGQPLYLAAPPTGYPDTAGDWMSPGALMARLNAVTGLVSGRLPGVTLPGPNAARWIRTLGTAEFQRR